MLREKLTLMNVEAHIRTKRLVGTGGEWIKEEPLYPSIMKYINNSYS